MFQTQNNPAEKYTKNDDCQVLVQCFSHDQDALSAMKNLILGKLEPNRQSVRAVDGAKIKLERTE